MPRTHVLSQSALTLLVAVNNSFWDIEVACACMRPGTVDDVACAGSKIFLNKSARLV